MAQKNKYQNQMSKIKCLKNTRKKEQKGEAASENRTDSRAFFPFSFLLSFLLFCLLSYFILFYFIFISSRVLVCENISSTFRRTCIVYILSESPNGHTHNGTVHIISISLLLALHRPFSHSLFANDIMSNYLQCFQKHKI